MSESEWTKWPKGGNDRPPNVHEFENSKGKKLYAVCVWDDFHNQYQRPLDAEERKLTGCFAEFSQSLEGLGGYKTLSQARRRARKLYGYSKLAR